MTGQTISHYDILEKLGEGGMGVVYKARDTRLDRDVALKFLPAHLAASEQDKARFVQEAKAAAALNHPNVCSIIDIQEHRPQGADEPQLFMVMEFVDGQTLRERMAGPGPGISLKQAIDIGIQVADGLATAHDKGIVHRDIKPENIMIRRDGIAQVMDFGLAKLRASGSKITRLTKQGSTVGTAGYMSPEQVTGQEADHRSDIFSLGVLLYELFTGELPFKGVHETALAYEIVNVDPPPMSVVRPALDPALDAIVLECLAKETTERFQSVAEVAKELRRFKRESSRKSVSRISGVRASGSYSGVTVPATPAHQTGSGEGPVAAGTLPGDRKRGAILPWSVAAVCLATAALLAWLYGTRQGPPAQEIRLSMVPPPGVLFAANRGSGNQAISPDGSMVVFSGRDSNNRLDLYLRRLDDPAPRRLTGTEGADYPFWSPDNRWIGFASDGKLRKLDISGGSPLTICDATAMRGGTWNASGTIVFNGVTGSSRLWSVSATGGQPVPATTDSSLETYSDRWPCFLPDGDHFLFTSASAVGSDEGNILVGSLSSTDVVEITHARSNAWYADGHLLFWREGRVLAQRFDPDAPGLEGEPFVVAEDVPYSDALFRADFSVSAGGIIIHSIRKEESSGASLSWFDREGKRLPGPDIGGNFVDVRFSPDGTRLALTQAPESGAGLDIMVYDLVRNVMGRLTFEPGVERWPVWSRDGKEIYYTSQQIGSRPGIYRKSANGVGSPVRLDSSDLPHRLLAISPDGRFLFYRQMKEDRTDEIYALPLQGGGKAIPVVANDFDNDAMSISPDGRWIAYMSTETGQLQVYVVPFPPTGSRWQISSGEMSGLPLWNPNGKELFYLTGGNVMAVEIGTRGDVLLPGTPRVLFSESVRLSGPMVYDISPDGKRFLSISDGGRQTRGGNLMEVVMNWRNDGN